MMFWIDVCGNFPVKNVSELLLPLSILKANLVFFREIQ